MKVIDLLNKIANGEEIKTFKFDGYIFKYDLDSKLWKNENGAIFSTYCYVEECLNDEIEIIEEEKKIPEKLKDILKVDDLTPPVDENMYKIWKQTIKNQNKINEICDYLNFRKQR